MEGGKSTFILTAHILYLFDRRLGFKLNSCNINQPLLLMYHANLATIRLSCSNSCNRKTCVITYPRNLTINAYNAIHRNFVINNPNYVGTVNFLAKWQAIVHPIQCKVHLPIFEFSDNAMGDNALRIRNQSWFHIQKRVIDTTLWVAFSRLIYAREFYSLVVISAK